MSWKAIEEVDEAVQKTKDFLLPFEVSVWVRMAIIVFFVGASIPSMFPSNTNYDDFSEEDDFQYEDKEIMDEFNVNSFSTSYVFVGLLLIILLVAVVYSFMSAVFEFIFYKSLEDGRPRILANFSRYSYAGLKLFFFRILWILGFAASVFATLGAFIYEPALGVVTLIVLIPVWLGLWLISFIVKNLVIPEMVLEDSGFIDSLKNGWSLTRKEWKEVGIFIITKIAIGIVVGMISGIGVLIGLIVLAIPLAILGLALVTVSEILIVVPILLGIIGIALIGFALTVPLRTYTYIWVLGVFKRF